MSDHQADQQQEDFTKLPLDKRLAHKNWKARVSGYEELTRKFTTEYDEDDPAPWQKHEGCLKKMVSDSNVVAHEAGMVCATAFFEFAPDRLAGSLKIQKDVLPSVCEKGLSASRTSAKEKARNLVITSIQAVNTGEYAVEVLLESASKAKQPKAMAGCLLTLTEAIKAFGCGILPPKETQQPQHMIINVRPILKLLPTFFAHKDKGVRQEAENLVVEFHRWLGEGVLGALQGLAEAQKKSLSAAIAKGKSSDPERPCPKLRTRVQRREHEAMLGSAADPGPDDEMTQEDQSDLVAPIDAGVDPWDIAEAVEILPKLDPKSMLDPLSRSKWTERRDALQAIVELTSAIRLKPDRYGELVNIVVKRIKSDANVNCVLLAVTIVKQLAKGLRKDFAGYRSLVTTPLLEKFKEKKTSVVEELRAALDAVFHCTSISDLQDDLVSSLKNKNPKIQAETCDFLTRCLKETRAIPPKAEIKPLVECASKCCEANDKTVREMAMESVAAMTKLLGERFMDNYLQNMDEIRKQKIKEKAEGMEVKFRQVEAKKPVPKKRLAHVVSASSIGVKDPPSKRAGGSLSGQAGSSSGAASTKTSSMEIDVPEKKPKVLQAVDLTELDPSIVSGLSDSNWRTRKTSLENVQNMLQNSPRPIRPMMGDFGPALKARLIDKNKAIVPAALETIQMVCESMGKLFERQLPNFAASIVHCLGDSKLQIRTSARATIDKISAVIGLGPVLNHVASSLTSTDSPTIRKELLKWVSDRPRGCKVASPLLMLPGVLQSTQHRDPEIRKYASLCLQWLVYVSGSHEQILKKMATMKPPNLSGLVQIVQSVRLEPVVPITESQEMMDVDRSSNGRSYTEGSRSSAKAPKARPEQASNRQVQAAADRGPGPSTISGTRQDLNPTFARPTPGMAMAPLAGSGPGLLHQPAAFGMNCLSGRSEPPMGAADFNSKERRAEFSFRFQTWVEKVAKNSGSSVSIAVDDDAQGVGGTLFDFLHDQMIGAKFGSDLCMLLFSPDPQEQLQGMNFLDSYIASGQIFQEDADEEAHGIRMSTIANSDLVLTYAVMRLVETDELTMNLKSLDLIEHLCCVLDHEGYHLMEREASIAIPGLILRLGDDKEPIRVRIKAILGHITHLYSPAELFSYLVACAWNPRGATRYQVFDEVNRLVQKYSVNVSADPQRVFGEIAVASLQDKEPIVRQMAHQILVTVASQSSVDEVVHRLLAGLSPDMRRTIEENLRKANIGPSGLHIQHNRFLGTQLGQEGAPGQLGSIPSRGSPVRQGPTSSNLAPMPNYAPDRSPAKFSHHAAHRDRDANPFLGQSPFHATSADRDHDIVMSDPQCAHQDSALVDMDAKADALFTGFVHGSTLDKIDSLKQMDEQFALNLTFAYHYCDRAVREIVLQMRTTMSEAPHMAGDEDHVRLCRQLINSLIQIFSRQLTLQGLHSTTLHGLLEELLGRLLEDLDPALSRPLNVLMIRVLENVDRNMVFEALLQILSETSLRLRFIDESKYVELVMKCLWKLTKTLQDNLRNSRIKLGPLLAAVSEFFRRAPTSEWKRRVEENVPLSDMPMRTVKTVLHEVVSCVGHEQVEQWILDNGKVNSNLEIYLKTLLDRRSSGGAAGVEAVTGDGGSGSAMTSEGSQDRRGAGRSTGAPSSHGYQGRTAGVRGVSGESGGLQGNAPGGMVWSGGSPDSSANFPGWHPAPSGTDNIRTYRERLDHLRQARRPMSSDGETWNAGQERISGLGAPKSASSLSSYQSTGARSSRDQAAVGPPSQAQRRGSGPGTAAGPPQDRAQTVADLKRRLEKMKRAMNHTHHHSSDA